MRKIVFEGTEEQIKNLKLLIDIGDNDLPRLRENYYQTANLWCVQDIHFLYECDYDDVALEILEGALTNGATMEQIWFAIDYYAEKKGLTKK